MSRLRLPSPRFVRLVIVLALLAGPIALVLWRFDINIVRHAFELVTWRWVVFAVLLNLASVLFRSIAWEIVIDEAVAAAAAAPPRRLRRLLRGTARKRRAAGPRGRGGASSCSRGACGAARASGRRSSGPCSPTALRRRRGIGPRYLGRLRRASPAVGRPALAIALGVGFGLLIAALVLARRTPGSRGRGSGRFAAVLSIARSD